MQRSSWFIIIIGLFLASGATAQIKTEGTRTEVDSTSGKTTTTTYVEVKKEEDITPRTNMIVVNPLKFWLFYNLSYYHAISPSAVIGGGLQMPTPESISGFGANAEMRFHPSKKALRGFYIAPNVSYNHLTYEYYFFDDTTRTVDAFSVGVLLGWQWFIGDDFAIGLGIGYDHYFLLGNEQEYFTLFGDYDGGTPALRFDIGYAWD
jgi:hypothetical protein